MDRWPGLLPLAAGALVLIFNERVAEAASASTRTAFGRPGHPLWGRFMAFLVGGAMVIGGLLILLGA